jgi:flagellar basal body rod protein FlgC
VIVGRTPSIALSALRAASARQATSAHNVASAHSAGLQPAAQASPVRPALQSEARTAASAGADAVTSSTDLAAETVAQMTSLHAFKAALASLRTADEMTESLLAIKA